MMDVDADFAAKIKAAQDEKNRKRFDEEQERRERSRIAYEAKLAEDKRRERYRDACVRAIETAAAKLGMDPATLAERCANGEIGTLVVACRDAGKVIAESIPVEQAVSVPGISGAIRGALQPFRETK